MKSVRKGHKLKLKIGLLLLVAIAERRLIADCSVTNLGVNPLNERGFATYSNFVGGLYPNGANTRPPMHDAAGRRIATNEIVPLNASGNLDTNSGKIVLLSLGMSNTTHEWASGDNMTHNTTNAFKYRPLASRFHASKQHWRIQGREPVVGVFQNRSDHDTMVFEEERCGGPGLRALRQHY